VVQRDGNREQRLLSKIKFQDKVDFKKAVIVDVRTRFDFEISRLPRSFHALVDDWNLKNYTGNELNKKRQQLQRLLSLKGIDPPTQVVILGYGLKGKGEEFLMATTLVSLGVNRLHFLNIEKAKESLGATELEPVANAPKWDKEFVQLFNCRHQENYQDEESKAADLVIDNSVGQENYSKFFNKNLEFIPQSISKRRGLKVSSPHSYWAYGLALHLADQGQQPCVL